MTFSLTALFAEVSVTGYFSVLSSQPSGTDSSLM